MFALKTSLILAMGVAISSAAMASGDLCKPTPKDQWQAIPALEKKLVAEGWTIKNIKIDKGCYEVYGTDGKGQRAEIYFDPKTLQAVKG